MFQMYVSKQNTMATEYDFKKALDLMQFLDAVSLGSVFKKLPEKISLKTASLY